MQEWDGRKKKYFDILMVGLALLSIWLLMYEIDHPEMMPITLTIDSFIAVIFLTEYIFSTMHASKKRDYAISHWYDLISAIPIPFSAIHIFRYTNIIRLIRLLRLLKINRAFPFLEKTKTGYPIVAFVMIVLFGGVCFQILEYDKNPHINDALDALYWSVSTITNVGYGDIVPVTDFGKVLAMLLMVGGIGIYASLAGILAGYFSNYPSRKTKKNKRAR